MVSDGCDCFTCRRWPWVGCKLGRTCVLDHHHIYRVSERRTMFAFWPLIFHSRSFAIGVGPVPFVMIPEVSPVHVRRISVTCPPSLCAYCLLRPFPLFPRSLCLSTVGYRPPAVSVASTDFFGRDCKLYCGTGILTTEEYIGWWRSSERRTSVLCFLWCHVILHCCSPEGL